MSLVSEIMLKILTKRGKYAKHFVRRSRFTFRRGCRTREAIVIMSILCKRSIENGNDVYICFVNFEKAFNRVDIV